MHYVSTWLFVTALLLVASITTAVGAIRRRSVSRFIGAVGLFILFLISGAVTVLKAGWKVLEKTRAVVTLSRTGNQMYIDLWGKAPNGCVEVIDHQDAVLPVIDDAVTLHFKTCPEELRRILGDKSYDVHRLDTASWPGGGRQARGNTVIQLLHTRERGGQQFYISEDSTEVYFTDWY